MRHTVNQSRFDQWQHCSRINTGRSQQLLDKLPSMKVHLYINLMGAEQRPHQGKTVTVQPRRGEPDQQIALLNPRTIDYLRAFDNSNRKTGNIKITATIGAG